MYSERVGWSLVFASAPYWENWEKYIYNEWNLLVGDSLESRKFSKPLSNKRSINNENKLVREKEEDDEAPSCRP